MSAYTFIYAEKYRQMKKQHNENKAVEDQKKEMEAQAQRKRQAEAEIALQEKEAAAKKPEPVKTIDAMPKTESKTKRTNPTS